MKIKSLVLSLLITTSSVAASDNHNEHNYVTDIDCNVVLDNAIARYPGTTVNINTHTFSYGYVYSVEFVEIRHVIGLVAINGKCEVSEYDI